MSPDKRPPKRSSKTGKKTVRVRMRALAGPPYVVRWHPDAAAERDASWPPDEQAAIFHAAQKLEAEGSRLRHPHSSAVQGPTGKGLRELRPRGGQSRWRPIYRQVAADTIVILAVAPEAMIDAAGFDAAVTRAKQRFENLEPE
jgi:hypothetical protein